MIRTFARSSPFDEEQIRNALSDDIINEFYDWFGTTDAWFLLPGTVEGLEKIKSAGIKLAVCSNSDERTPLILKRFGLDNFFDVGFVTHSMSLFYFDMLAIIFSSLLLVFTLFTQLQLYEA